MQILDERDVAEVVEGPVTVVKSALELGSEDVSGVRLTVRSSASDPVAVQVVEEFPGHVSMSDVQVHPSYGPNRWTISEQAHRMMFEDEVPPGGSTKTIYGVRITHEGALDPFLGRPTLSVDVPEGGPSADGEGPSDLAAAAPDSGPPADEESSSTTTEPASPATDEPAGDDRPAASKDDGAFVYGEDRPRSTADRGASAGSSTREKTKTDGPLSDEAVEVLIERLARTELSDVQRGALREALDLDPEQSQRIQLADLQSSVARLSAFAADYEALVDAVGPPAEAIQALEASVEQLAGTVEELSATDGAGQAAHEELRERVDGLEHDLQELRTDQSNRVDDLDDRLAELEAVLDADEFASIREVIEAERAWRERATVSRSGRPESMSGTPAN